MPLVEVRVPTYNRPEWLLRALQSLRKQTHTNWKAIVLDDSDDENDARHVVEEFGDERIVYQKNTVRLGGAGNIDQSFRKVPFFEGAKYATILEDDNWFYPDFIRKNIEDIEEFGTSILLRNQETWEQGEEGEPVKTDRTTRGKWFKEKVYQPNELHAFLMFHEGISNGGMFWKTDIKSDLMVGETVEDPGLQEFLRTLQIQEPIYFAYTPLCAWSKMDDDLVSRYISKSRIYSLGRLSVMRYVFQKYKKPIITLAHQIAQDAGQIRLFEEALIQLGKGSARGVPFYHVNMLERYELWIKTRIKERIFRKPLKKYFKLKKGLV